MRISPLLAGVLLLAACQRAETPEQMQARIDTESAAARQVIEAAATSFEQHFSAGHADSVAAFYAGRARLMPANGPMVVGRDSIRSWLTQGLAMGSYALDLTVENVVANGAIAIESGRYTLAFTPGANAPMPAFADTGKYMVHWHKVGDQWLIAEDIWNSDIPMPPPQPTRRRG